MLFVVIRFFSYVFVVFYSFDGRCFWPFSFILLGRLCLLWLIQFWECCVLCESVAYSNSFSLCLFSILFFASFIRFFFLSRLLLLLFFFFFFFYLYFRVSCTSYYYYFLSLFLFHFLFLHILVCKVCVWGIRRLYYESSEHRKRERERNKGTENLTVNLTCLHNKQHFIDLNRNIYISSMKRVLFARSVVNYE